MDRYLTKSRFILGWQCPTKLFYTGKPQYPDTRLDNDFLAALAEGGFQVGALAKIYHEGGVEITEIDKDRAVQKTSDLLKKKRAIIYEGAIQYKQFFVKADIIEKTGRKISLIEVKSKSVDGDEQSVFLGRNGGILSGWKPYIYDVAFQTFVFKKAFPDFTIIPYLMLADKAAATAIDGLNQKFLLKTENGRTSVVVSDQVTRDSLGTEILIKIDVSNIVGAILMDTDFDGTGKSFEDFAEFLADIYVNDRFITTPLSSSCRGCEFQATPEEESSGFKNGFKECWKKQLSWDDTYFNRPLSLSLWNFRRLNDLISRGYYHLEDIPESEIRTGKTKPPLKGLSVQDRQWLQIEKVRNNDPEPYTDINGIRREINSWQFPLHFIDFETTLVAIPFYKNFHPYEAVAFQFSHHVVDEKGNVEHRGEYINAEPGNFPNFEFLRALKDELDKDCGTIFRYAPHENTILNFIYCQVDSSDLADKEDLLQFIREITHSSGSSIEEWEGERDMVDMFEIVKRFYYHPLMAGSNSIKAVLPAVLNHSTFLQKKYVKPIYGAKRGIKSHNFKNQVWIKIDPAGKVENPYKLLVPLGVLPESVDEDSLLFNTEFIAEGGAAMMAYAKMQFTQMSDAERGSIKKGLLRYCELDTLAMVMIYEYWKDLCGGES